MFVLVLECGFVNVLSFVFWFLLIKEVWFCECLEVFVFSACLGGVFL